MSSLKDKVPPHNLEAEQAVLGALLLDWDAVGAVIRYLRAENFYSLQNQKIFNAILSLFNKGQRGDLITLIDELRSTDELDRAGGPGYITALTNTVPTSANVEYYAKIVLEQSIRRDLMKISGRIIAQAVDDSVSSRLVLEDAQKQIFNLADTNQDYTFKTSNQILSEAIAAIETRYHNKAAFTGIPSGLHDLDKMTSGFQKTELTIIGARPSMGKTALALSMAQHIAIHEKIPTAFFSLEMSDLQLMFRLMSAEARIPSELIRNGFLKLRDFQALQDAAGVIYDAPLYIIDTPNMKLLDLRAMARRLKAQHDIQIIFIDYITLITSENIMLPRHEQIAEVSRSLKSLARELHIPVVALSQVTRDTEGKKPQLSNIRESGSIEQDADVVMFIHRDKAEQVSKDGQVSAGLPTEIIISKQRNGPIGDVTVTFIPSYTKFENYTGEKT